MENDDLMFGFKNSKEAYAKFERAKKLLDDIKAVEKFSVALGVYEYLSKHPSIKRWAVVLEKAEYNDEGLDSGAYVDFATEKEPTKELFNSGYEFEYNYEDNATEKHHKLNGILYGYYMSNCYSSSEVFPNGEYENSKVGFKKFVTDFIGKDYYQRWEAESTKKSVTELVDKKRPSKSTKVVPKKI